MENTNDINATISTLAEMQKTTMEILQKLAGTTVSLLSGQPQHQTEARRRGRPKGSKNKSKGGAVEASTAIQTSTPAPTHKPLVAMPDAPPAEKPLHPTSIEMLNRIMKEGKVRFTDLADGAKVNRSLVHYHLTPLLEKGKIKVMLYSINGRKNLVAYRPDWVLVNE